MFPKELTQPYRTVPLEVLGTVQVVEALYGTGYVLLSV